MKSVKNMSRGELAAYVSSHLNKHGVTVVLSGGSCVSIYSNEIYVLYDLDFIDNGFTKKSIYTQILATIGFVEKQRYYVHSKTRFWLEFPAGPLSIGEESVKEINTIRYSTGELKLLSATDCVKDRLSAFYHWKDLQGLEQALLVTQHVKIDLNEVKRWSKNENMMEKFNEFKCKISE